MRTVLLMSIAALGLAALPAVAQTPRRPPMANDAPGDYRGGAGSPSSTAASNIGPNSTRSEIAPRLPSPDANANSPEALMRSALRSLDQNKTGAAQQALEMAETRVLSRTTDPSMSGTPDQSMMVKHLGDARRALGARDVNGAKEALRMALNAPVPPPGPAVTTTYVPQVQQPYAQPYMGAPMAPMPVPRAY